MPDALNDRFPIETQRVAGRAAPLVSLVIPVLNEEEAAPHLIEELRTILHGVRWEVVFVDDGSTDRTAGIIEAASCVDKRFRLLRFSRNFGHQAAVTAGLDFAEGDAVIVMDADLQDPPELLPKMVDLFIEGYDIVSPRRISRDSDSRFKRWTAATFYSILTRMADQPMAPEVGDFRLFSRRAVLAIRSLREQHRYMRGMAAWLGLKEVMVPFERQARVAGSTHYSLLKMIRLAWTGISSFSAFPLRISMYAGSLLSFAGFCYLARVVYLALFTHELVPGWASVVALQCAFSGVILLAIAAIGDYVGRTYEEAKHRPLYVVSELVNLAYPAVAPGRAVVLERIERHTHEAPASHPESLIYANAAVESDEQLPLYSGGGTHS
jgi:dolichol-phosphate mannosyltransferase